MFCMHGVALAVPFAGGLLVVAHPQIERVAMSTPAAHIRVNMRNPPTFGIFGKTARPTLLLPEFLRGQPHNSVLTAARVGYGAESALIVT